MTVDPQVVQPHEYCGDYLFDSDGCLDCLEDVLADAQERLNAAASCGVVELINEFFNVVGVCGLSKSGCSLRVYSDTLQAEVDKALPFFEPLLRQALAELPPMEDGEERAQDYSLGVFLVEMIRTSPVAVGSLLVNGFHTYPVGV
jgi:hypothetical protein